MVDGACTYLLIDGENLDTVLGGILGRRKPDPGDRPRWPELLRFAEDVWAQPVRALFYLNAGSATTVQTLRPGLLPFVQALHGMGFRAILLSGQADEKVVDVGIKRTLDALRGRTGDVLLGSHDGDFAEEMKTLRLLGRRVAVIGFQELVSQRLREATGNTIFDLEDQVRAFAAPLPRVRIIPLDQFDPEKFL